MRGLPQRIVVDGFIRKAIFKAARRKRKIFCFAERGENSTAMHAKKMTTE